jgi:hypothetical protein
MTNADLAKLVDTSARFAAATPRSDVRSLVGAETFSPARRRVAAYS